MGKNLDWKIPILFLVTWILVYLSYIASVSNFIKVSFVLIILYLSGEYLFRKLGLGKELIFLLWRSKRYLNVLKDMSIKYKHIFSFLADSAIFVAFGLFGFLVISWKSLKEKLKNFVFGYLVLYLITYVYGSVVPLFMIMLGIGFEGGASSFLGYLVYIFGLAPLVFFSLLYTSLNILISLISILFGEQRTVSQAVALLLPGINLPFLEGILALAIVLIVHEFSHGIVAIGERIKVRSMGIVTFGTIPVGAFVEPDEKGLFASSKKSFVRTIISGVSSNFLTAIIVFGFFLIFLSLTQQFSSPSCLLVVENKLYHVFSCHEKALTFEGEVIEFKPDQIKNKIILEGDEMLRYYESPLLRFIYNFFLLTISLNLVVGVINLLPVPFFDGNLISSRVLPKKAHDLVSFLALLSLLISFLPSLI